MTNDTAAICLEYTGIDAATIPETPASIRTLSFVFLVVTVPLTLSCLALFLYYRKRFSNLRKRNATLITLLILGIAVSLEQRFHSIAFGAENYNCRLLSIQGSFAIILYVLPHTFRIFGYVSKIRFTEDFLNARVAELDIVLHGSTTKSAFDDFSKTEEEESGIKCCASLKRAIMFFSCWSTNPQIPEHLAFSHFLSNSFFVPGFFWFLFIVFVMLSFFQSFFGYLPTGTECFGCVGQGSAGALYSVFALFFATYNIWIIVRLRKYPDSLGVRRDIYALCGSFLLHTIIMQLLVIIIIDPDISIRVLLSGILQFVFSLPLLLSALILPVLEEKRRHRRKAGVLNLKDFLQSRKNLQLYLLYLSAKLSAESLILYKAIEMWKKEYDTCSKENNLEKLKNIYETYIGQGSVFEVNTSWRSKEAIRLSIVSENIEKTILDGIYREMYDILNDDFLDFSESIYEHTAMNSQLTDVAIGSLGRTRVHSAGNDFLYS